MKKTVPLTVIVVLLATALLLIMSTITSKSEPSPFLIAATIVSVVAVLGAAFSFFTESRAQNR
jgi:uncharacterized membrane protein YhiD involved in acid resistance